MKLIIQRYNPNDKPKTLRANSGHKKCLTSNLRKMLKEKFIDFDVYQLGE